MPPFWLIFRVGSDAVTSYFHCCYALARPEELVQWKEIHENLLESIRAMGKLVNQQMLLKVSLLGLLTKFACWMHFNFSIPRTQDLHDTRICNQLLEPETNDDIWHQDEVSYSTSQFARTRSNDDHESGHQNYLEATLKFQPGHFACQQVWETHFPLHPRLKTGPGKLGTCKGVQQLRFVLNAFSINNRNNMFVYQEDCGNVFYLRLDESSCIGHKTPSGMLPVRCKRDLFN